MKKQYIKECIKIQLVKKTRSFLNSDSSLHPIGPQGEKKFGAKKNNTESITCTACHRRFIKIR